MGLKLERAIDDVDRMERKLLMLQNQKKEAQARLKLVENEEIVKTIRLLKLDHRQLASLLDGLNSGTVSFTDIKEAAQEADVQNDASSTEEQ